MQQPSTRPSKSGLLILISHGLSSIGNAALPLGIRILDSQQFVHATLPFSAVTLGLMVSRALLGESQFYLQTGIPRGLKQQVQVVAVAGTIPAIIGLLGWCFSRESIWLTFGALGWVCAYQDALRYRLIASQHVRRLVLADCSWIFILALAFSPLAPPVSWEHAWFLGGVTSIGICLSHRSPPPGIASGERSLFRTLRAPSTRSLLFDSAAGRLIAEFQIYVLALVAGHVASDYRLAQTFMGAFFAVFAGLRTAILSSVRGDLNRISEVARLLRLAASGVYLTASSLGLAIVGFQTQLGFALIALSMGAWIDQQVSIRSTQLRFAERGSDAVRLRSLFSCGMIIGFASSVWILPNQALAWSCLGGSLMGWIATLSKRIHGRLSVQK